MKNGIHLSRDGRTYGPYSEDQIRELIKSGHASPDDDAWEKGMADWKPLRSLIPAIPPPISRTSERKKGISGMAIAAIILSALIVVGLFGIAISDTNTEPSPVDYYYEATSMVRTRLKTPSTAKFSSPNADQSGFQKVSGNIWEASGTVDHQNMFGAMIRSPWCLVWNVANRKILFLGIDLENMIGNYKEAIALAKTPQP